MTRDLIDSDGENRAVRCFLMLYGGTNSPTVEQMRMHLAASGFEECWPDWAASEYGHLTKGGAQDWLRHLFALEAGCHSSAEPLTDMAEMIERGTKAWSDTPDHWLEELRGNETAGPIDANNLEQLAKERPNECFLKGSGVLKLTGAIRQLEQQLRSAQTAVPLTQELERAWLRKTLTEVRGIAARFHEGPFQAGMDTACEEIAERCRLSRTVPLRPEHE